MIYTINGILPALKNDVLQCEDIMLSEISQSQKETVNKVPRSDT